MGIIPFFDSGEQLPVNEMWDQLQRINYAVDTTAQKLVEEFGFSETIIESPLEVSAQTTSNVVSIEDERTQRAAAHALDQAAIEELEEEERLAAIRRRIEREAA